MSSVIAKFVHVARQPRLRHVETGSRYPQNRRPEAPGSDAAHRTAGNPMAQSRVYIGRPEGVIKEISMEERRAENEKIILQNARRDDLPHKLCPLHGLVRDDGAHANCRVSSVPWWAQHDF
jgi:hypothetical protein